MRFVYVCVLSALFALNLAAQDSNSAPATASERTPAEEAARYLLPLTAEELAEEATKQQQKVADALRAIDPAQSDPDLQARADEEIARLKQVLDDWEAKGGDPTELRKYVSAVSHGKEDQSAAWGRRLKSWISSPEGGIGLGINLLKFLAVLIVARFVARFAARMTKKVLSRSEQLSDLLKDFIANTVRRVIMILGLVVALSMLGINIGPLLAGIGVIGFVVGFALQDTLGNFAAGFMILLNRPYDLGDFVTVSGESGSVDAMNLFSTTLRTPDNKVIVIPNGSIWGNVITNFNGKDTRRVDLTFGIGYGDDATKAKEVLAGIVAGHEKVLETPAPAIHIHELADSSVNLIVRPWVKTPDYWSVYWDLTTAVKERFDAEGINFPYPTRDLNIVSQPAS